MSPRPELSDDHAALLEKHAPILRFDDRELFFPIAVEGYVHGSALIHDGQELIPQGAVSLDDLGKAPRDSYLRFVSEHDRRSVVTEEARRMARKILTPRLGRVGLFGRILDALFLLSVLLRPTVPRGTTTAAALKTERLELERGPAPCYARAFTSGEWLVLHYSYFYSFNDWRTGYRGLNDHEADWEQAWVFLDPGTNEPVWVVASNHNFDGTDLRRHWNDPELLRNGQQPILHAGAGSHALYFRPGDYVTRLSVPGFGWMFRAQRWVQRTLRIADTATERGLGPALGAPFVDTATGDGKEIRDWSLLLLDDAHPWFGNFRGLWGLDTSDPLGGERGPAGPKFTREGEVRTSWADPVGFSGLHGTPPPSATNRRVNRSKLIHAIADLDEQIKRRGRLLPLAHFTADPEEMAIESERLTQLLKQKVELEGLEERIERGELGSDDLRAHLQQPAIPLPPPKESGLLLAFWAAVSIPLLLFSVAAVLLFETVTIAGLTLAMGAGVALGEQLVRRHFQAVLRLLVLYALIVGFFLFVFGGAVAVSRIGIGAFIAVAGALLFAANLGELGAAQRYRMMMREHHRNAIDDESTRIEERRRQPRDPQPRSEEDTPPTL